MLSPTTRVAPLSPEPGTALGTTPARDTAGSDAGSTLPSIAQIAAIRGVSDATADTSECACPEFCERDHANE